MDGVQVNGANTTAETLAALLEQVTALIKKISLVQRDVNRWKEQEQQFGAEEEEMYDVEDSFPASRSTPIIDLMTDSTSQLRELPQIGEIQETPLLPPLPPASSIAPGSVHSQLKVASVGHPKRSSA